MGTHLEDPTGFVKVEMKVVPKVDPKVVKMVEMKEMKITKVQ